MTKDLDQLIDALVPKLDFVVGDIVVRNDGAMREVTDVEDDKGIMRIAKIDARDQGAWHCIDNGRLLTGPTYNSRMPIAADIARVLSAEQIQRIEDTITNLSN